MSILKFEFTYDTDSGEFSVINTETGEVKSTVKKRKSAKRDTGTEPKLFLETNKYTLSQAAIDLMGIEPDCKLDIKYEKRGVQTIPVIGTDEAFGTKSGCRLTKSNTVSCRGAKNVELAKYGSEFTLIPHESKVGIYILQNKDIELERALDDTLDKIDAPNEEIDLPMDIDLQDLIDDKDATVTEVNPSIFNLNI